MEDLKKYKILVVGDRVKNLKSIISILKKSGYKTDLALSGKEALTFLLNNTYGLLIIEITMPEMNGFELTERLKENNKTKNIPVLFLTDNTIKTEFFKNCIERGTIDFLINPINESLLLLKINNFLLSYDTSSMLEKANRLLKKKAVYAKISYGDLYFSLLQDIFLISKEGVIISVNRTNKISAGFLVKDLLNNHYSKSPFLNEILHNNISSNFFEFYTENPDSYKQFEFKSKRSDDTVYYGEATITITMADGRLCSQLSLIDVSEKRKVFEKLELNYKEISYSDQMNKALLDGASIAEISMILMNGLDEICQAKTCRIYAYDENTNSLSVISENIESDLVQIMEQKFGLSLSNIIPPLTEKSKFTELIRSKNSFFTTNKKEIVKIMKDHTSNLILKKLASWAVNILNIKTSGTIPLLSKNKVLGLVTLSSPFYMSDEMKEVIIRLTNHVSNIINKKNDELALKESESFNRSVLNSLSSQMAVIDSSGKIISVNDAWNNFSLHNGVTNFNRIGIGSNYFEMCEEAIAQGDPYIRKALQGIKSVLNDKGPRFSMEYPVHSHGTERWFILSVSGFEGDVKKAVIRHIEITERKEKEEALKANESRLRTAQRMAKIGDWWIDLATHEMIWSDELYKIYNCDKKTFVPSVDSLLEFLHPDDKKYLSSWIKNLYLGIKSEALTFRIINPDKSIKFILGDGEIVFDNKGKPLRAFGTAQDISLFKLTEDKVKESEERFNIAMQGANDGLWDWNLLTNKVYFSPRWKSMLGYEENELEGYVSTWEKLLHNDDKTHVLKALNDYLEKKTPDYQVEFRMKHKNGHFINILARGKSVLDKDGNYIRIVGTHVDITERVKAQEKIKMSELRLNIAQRIGKIGNWEFDVSTGNVIWSAEMFNIFNCQQETFIPQYNSIFSFVVPEDHLLLSEWFDLSNSKLSAPPIMFRIKDSHNTVKFIRASFEVMTDYSGNSKKIIGTMQDVTDLKNTENHLNKTVEDLNNSYNDMKQFNYIVSHNLRAPLANIIGLTDIFDMPSVSKEEKIKIIGHIRSSSMKIDELLKDLNLILGSRAGINSKKEKVYLSQIINSITDSLEKQIMESKTIIKTQISNDSDALFTIKSYLESILFNLISNSIKYRSSKQVAQINISAKIKHNNYCISVSDNGIGIDLPTHGKYVFGLYKRFNTEIEGKGLGLHMTKIQVEAIGGKIAIESEPDKGTTFNISIPKSEL